MKFQRCPISLGNIIYSRVSQEEGWSEEKETLKMKKKNPCFQL